jgi:ABC-type glycerol-3-phosphate transport system substrate-binding protein
MANVTRRQFLKRTIAGGTAITGAVIIPRSLRKAYAQKAKLNVAWLSTWIPGMDDVWDKIFNDWAKKNNVEVNINRIAGQCRDLRAVALTESQAGSGHDMTWFCSIDGLPFNEYLEPLNDVADYIQRKYGKFDELGKYTSYLDGAWWTVPLHSYSHAMVSRIDLFREHAGINLLELFPPDVTKREKSKVDAWTYDVFLDAAKKLHNAGYPFGNPIGKVYDAGQWLYPIMLSYGSVPIDKDGKVTIESDETLKAVELVKELSKYMPKDIFGWDDRANNTWITSGKGSCIHNPPSAWVAAKKTRPDIAAQLWHHDNPRGPKGRFRAAVTTNIGVWKWCKEKNAAKDLIMYLLESPQQWKEFHGMQGYGIPNLKPMYAHPVWGESSPPRGTLYNYVPRGDEQLKLVGWPAPPDIGAEIHSRYIIPAMMAKAATGKMSANEAMKWAAGELEAIV